MSRPEKIFRALGAADSCFKLSSFWESVLLKDLLLGQVKVSELLFEKISQPNINLNFSESAVSPMA